MPSSSCLRQTVRGLGGYFGNRRRKVVLCQYLDKFRKLKIINRIQQGSPSTARAHSGVSPCLPDRCGFVAGVGLRLNCFLYRLAVND